MKYARLTKEQFEELHLEFVNFLATQSIDKAEWDAIKTNQPALAEQELDVFSDLIWEGVLTRAQFLEHFSSQRVFLFKAGETNMHSIVIEAVDKKVDLLTQSGLQWLADHMFTDDVTIKTGSKSYQGDRNESLFSLIRQGSVLSDGIFYNQISGIING